MSYRKSLGVNGYSLVRRSVRDGKILLERYFGSYIEAIAYDPASKVVVAVGSGQFTISKLDSDNSVSGLCESKSCSYEVQFSPNGRYFVVSHYDGTVEVRNALDGTLSSVVTIPGELALSACISNSGGNGIVATLSSGYAVDFRLNTLQRLGMPIRPPVLMFDDGSRSIVNFESDDSHAIDILRTSDGASEGHLFPDLFAFRTISDAAVLCARVRFNQDGTVNLLPTRVCMGLHPSAIAESIKIEENVVNVINRLRLSPSGETVAIAAYDGKISFFSAKSPYSWNIDSADEEVSGKSVAIGLTMAIVALGLLIYCLLWRSRRGD